MAKMYDYWKAQPDALKAVIADRKALTSEFVKLYQEVNPDRLYLIGSGTSFNSTKPASLFMEKILGIEVTRVVASMVDKIHGKNPMVVFISQGGSSTNTVAVIGRMNYPYIAITGEETSHIQSIAKRHEHIGCGEEEAGPKTKGYVTSVMHFYLCALEAALATGKIDAAEYDRNIKVFEKAADNMAENLKLTEAFFEQRIEEFKALKKYVVVGKNFDGLVADEGALKLLETVKCPATAFEFEEYLHGPIIETDADLGGIFYITEDPVDKPRMLGVAEAHSKFSKYTYIIARNADVKGEHVLNVVATGCPYTAIFEYILLPQLIGARIPDLIGLSGHGDIFDVIMKVAPIKHEGGK